MNDRLQVMLEEPGGNGKARRMPRAVPESLDAEKGLIGSMLLKASLVDDSGDLPIEAFNHPAHRVIVEMLREMSSRLMPCDFVTLTNQLEARGVLENVGGAVYVTELFTFIESASNWSHYADIVREKWIRRKLLELGGMIRELAYQDVETSEELLSHCEEAAIKLRREVLPGSSDAVKQCREATHKAMDYIEAVFHGRGKVLGVESGLFDWDRRTNGFKAQELIVIGARPSQGKTALGMQIAAHNAFDCGRPTAVFSCEMSAEQLMKRVLMTRTRVDQQKLRDGFFSKLEMSQLHDTVSKIEGGPLYIDETPGLTIAQLRARARSAKVRWKIELLVVDYLQLMRSLSKRAEGSRQVEIAEISGACKAIAKELNIPVIVLSQLSRDAESLGRAPKLTDLRESGSIENDADQVLLIWHPYKDKKKKEDDSEEDGNKDEPKKVKLILAKQRDGPTNDFDALWCPQFTTFESLTKKLYSNKEEEREH